MHSSHMQGKRSASRSGYGCGSSFAQGAGCNRSFAFSFSSASRAAAIAARSASSGSGVISRCTEKKLMPAAPRVDENSVVQKLATLAAVGVSAALLAAVAVGATASSSSHPPNWAKKEIKTVVAHGLMGASSVSTFKPNAALTVQTLADLANGLGQELGPPAAS